MKKRVISLFLLCAMLVQLCCTPAVALGASAVVGNRPVQVEPNEFGDVEIEAEESDFTWNLSTTGWLYLYGTGDMPDYPNGFPWADRKDEIVRVVVGEGITSISDLAFYGCSGLTSVSLPHGLERVGIKAFGATALTTLVVPSTVTEFDSEAVTFCKALTDVYFYGDNPMLDQDGSLSVDAVVHYASGTSGWEDVTGAKPFYGYGGRRYEPQPITGYYSDARDTAWDMGGYLLTVTSAGEEAFIRSLLPGQTVWLGASCDSMGMMWSWESGEMWTDYCASKLPYSYDPSQTCLSMDGNGEWQVSDGMDYRLVVVEFLDYEAPDPLSWDFDEATGTLTVYGEGEMPEYPIGGDMHPVTGAPWAEYYRDIRTLKIMPGVTSVSKAAFAGCGNLETIILPDGLTDIGVGAFEGAGVKTVNQLVSMGSLMEIPGFPYTLTTIGDQAFYGNSGMTELDLAGTSVETIGENAFGWQSDLTTVALPDTLVTLGDCAFAGCSFASAVLPASLKTMGSETFGSNANLTDLYFCGDRPFDSIETAGETVIHCKTLDDGWRSFTRNGESASAVEFPSYQGHQFLYVAGEYTYGHASTIARMMGGFVATVADEAENAAYAAAMPQGAVPAWLGAFYAEGTWNWTSGETFDYSNFSGPVTPSDGHYAVMTMGGTWSSRPSMQYCGIMVEFPTPVSTTIVTVTIGNATYIFDKSRGMLLQAVCHEGTLTVPAAIEGVPVQHISGAAFANCTGLTMLDLSATSVTSFNRLFANQSGLKTVVMPSTAAFVMDDCFYGCPALESVIFSGGAPVLSTESMDGHMVTDEFFAPNVVFYYVDGAEGWTAAHWSGVPALPVTAGGYLREDAGDVTLLVDEDGVVVSYIGSAAEITIPETAGEVTVTGLGDRLFYEDTVLTALNVPACVISIGEHAFFGTEYLRTITFDGDAPTDVADTAFDNVSPDLLIHCPEDGEGWTNPWHGVKTNLPAADIVYFEVPGGQLIFDRATGTISGYTGSPTAIVVPDKIAGVTVAAIADGAMKNAADLSSMDLSATAITATGPDIWDGCSDLVRLVLPETVTSIDISALTGCSSISQFIFLGDEPVIESFSGNDWPSATDYTLWFSEEAAMGSMLNGMPFVKKFLTLNVDRGSILLERSSGLVVGYLGQPADVTIPAALYFSGGALDVRGIGKFAFESCLSLETISVPDGMTVLERSAFHNCEYLQAVDLSRTALTVLEEKVFHNCLRVESILLPEGITSIGSFCFNDCNALKELTIPSAVTAVSEGAFYKCDTLEELVFPAALTTLSGYAIPYCGNLKTVDLSRTSITRIEGATFAACPALEEVWLPETLETVHQAAFNGCTAVTALYFAGDAPTATGDMSAALPNATVYYQPEASGWGTSWYGLPTGQDPAWVLYDVAGGQLIFNTRTGEIAGYAGAPVAVVVPAEIGDAAVTGIAKGAFAGCSSLAVMDLSAAAVTSVGAGAWENCSALVRLVLPNTVESFDLSALNGCSALMNTVFTGDCPVPEGSIPGTLPNEFAVWYPAGAENWPEGFDFIREYIPLSVPGGTLVYDGEGCVLVTYYGQPTRVADLTLPVTEIAPRAFAYCAALNNVTLPATVTAIGEQAFAECGGLQYADLSCTAETELQDELFLNCAELEVVLLPDVLQSLNGRVFAGCAALHDLSLPETLTYVGPGTFSGCASLTELTFSASLSRLFANAFAGSGVKKLTFSGNAPEIMPPNGNAGKLSNYIPDAVVYYMEFTDGWSDPFSGLQAVSYPNPYLVRYAVPGGALIFDKTTGRIVSHEGAPTSIQLPADIENVAVTGFAAGALKNCTSLVWVDLRDISMTVLPADLFSGCTALTDVVLAPQTSVMDGSAFSGCTALERLMFTGPAPEQPDSTVQDLSTVAPKAVVYFPEEYSDCWTTPLWYANEAYPYSTREGDVSWPYPGGTLFFDPDSGAFVGCSLYRRHILIPETVRGQQVQAITADAFAGHNFMRMFFLGKAPEEMDLSGCPEGTALYYPVADADLWEDTVQGFTARPYSPASDWVSRDVTGGTILLDPANGLISGHTGSPTQLLVPASVSGHAVTGVRGDAFEGAESVELVILPDSVTCVEPDAFWDCSADVYGPKALGFTPLSVTATEPVNFSTVGGSTVTLKVTTNIPYTLPITLSDGMITACTDGVYTFRVDLSALEEGEYTHTFALTCADYGLSHEITLFVDRKAPSVPGQFRAEAGVLSNTLYWDAPPEANVAGYRIWLDTADGFELLAELEGKNTLTFTHAGLTAGEKVTYAVTAFDVYGQESGRSSSASATPMPDNVAPVVTAVSPKNGETLTGTVTVTVDAEDNIGLASVTLSFSNGAEPEDWTVLDTVSFTDAARGTAYFKVDTTAFDDTQPLYVLITAADIHGNEGQADAVFTYALDNTPPEQVTGLHAEATTTVITLNWSDVAARDFKEFRVEQLMDGQWSYVGGTSTALGIQVSGLTPATLYTFRVRAVDKCGNEGPWSEELSVATLADVYPPVITAIRPEPGYYNGSIPLTCTAHDDFGIASWLVQVSYDGQLWTDVTEVTSPATTFRYSLDTSGLEEGSIFVRAVVTDRYGNVSNTGSDAPCNQYVVDRTAPATPSGVTLTAGDGYLDILWEKGREEDLYTYSVWRSATGEEGTFSLLQGSLQQLYWRDSAVEYGETYYYYVTVCDRAGNVSGCSAVVSGIPLDDSMPPRVVSISPSEGYVLGRDSVIRVRLYDNNKVTALCWQVNEGEVCSTEIGVSDGVADLPLDLSALGSSFALTVWCVDAAGHESEPAGRTYSVDLTPPACTQVTAEAAPMSVVLTWPAVADEDLAGYQVFRSVNGGSWAMLTQRSAGSDSYTYTDRDVAVGSLYSYYIRTVDTRGNTADGEAAPAVEPIDKDIQPPSAILDGSVNGVVGHEMAFSAKRSQDDRGIASYAWDFGDGTTSVLMEPVHAYDAVGTYTVSLTVTDTSGNRTAASYQVKVAEPTRLGSLTVTVVDENGAAVPSAGVWLDLGEEDQSVVYTDARGQVTVSLPVGSHIIGAYLEGYLPARETVNISAGVNSDLRLVTVQKDLVVGDLTVERMTLEEIIAAGIDVTDPANQQVFHFTIHLTYGTYEAMIETMYNGEGEVLKDPEPIHIFNQDDEEREVTVTIVPIGGGGGGTGGGGGWGDTPETPMVVVLDIPGTASWLKDFFEVHLTVFNQADSEFALDNCFATLNVPGGLTLMETAITSSDPGRSMGTIYGQSSAEATWIIRGDKGGDYDLSADFSAILRDFECPVNARFETKEPFHVREGDGLTLEIKVENAIMADADGAIRVGLRNDDPNPYYLPDITLDPDLVTLIDNFKTAGYVTLDTGLDVLNTGETIWWDYIVPRENWDVLFKREGEDFYLLDAIVEATGGVELPWTIEEVLPFTIGPDLIEVSRLSSGGGESAISYVNLAKTGATGGDVPTLRIRTYRLDPVSGEYVPTSMEINIKDEHLMEKGDMDETKGLTVTTNAEGYYDLPGYRLTSLNNDKTYNIRISARRAQAVEIPVVLRGKTAEVGRLDVYVYTTNEKGEIVPLKGATVTLPGHEISDTADKDGKAEFKYVDQGYQEIVVTMDGYLPVTDLVTVAEDSEFSYRMVADDDPNASRVLSVTNSLTQWSSGNQVIFPEGRVKGSIQFRLERRVAEGETFRRYLYRIVRSGAVAEEGEFTSDTGFMLEAALLKAGDKLQFAVETFTKGDILCVSPYTDSGIVVTDAPGFWGDLAFSLSDLSKLGLFMDTGKSFEYRSESVIGEKTFTLDQIAKGVQTKDDEDGKQQTVIEEMNKGSFETRKEAKLIPIQAKYEMSGKFTLSVIAGSADILEKQNSTRITTSTPGATSYESSVVYKDSPWEKERKSTGMFRLDFIFQYDPARNDWDLTVQGTVAAEQEFTIAKAPTKLLLLKLTGKFQESATLNLYETGVGPDSHSEVLGNGDLFDKAALAGELKGAVGVKAGSEKVASGDVYLKFGLEFEFLPDLILAASSALGIEGNVLIWGGEKDLLGDKWVFSPEAKPTNLSAMLGQDNTVLTSVRGSTAPTLGSGDTVISDIFGDADPCLAMLPDGRVLMVWCGYTEDEGAPVGLYWAIWDGTSWSAPALVERDGTADLYPAMVTVDGVPHLVWVDFTESVPADMGSLTLDQIRDYAFSRLGVSYASFDGSGWTSADLYEGGSIAAVPRVAVAPDGRVMVAWLGNEGNRETADTDNPDLVRWMLLRDGAVVDSGVVNAPSVAIGDLALGFANGFRMSLLAETADGRTRVHQTRYTAAGWLEPAEAGSLTGEDSNMVMSPDGKVYFINSGRLYCYESGHLVHLLCHELLTEDSNHLTWAETAEGGVLLWTATTADGCHSLIALAVSDSGAVGSPVVITGVEEGTLTCPAAAQMGSELMILSARNRQEGDSWLRDLTKTTRTLGVDISLTDGRVYHSGYLIPGAAMETMVAPVDLGLAASDRFTASVVREDGSVIAFAEGGLTATIQWTVPADYAGETLYLTVSAAGDTHSENDTVVMDNVVRDLALSDLVHVGRMDGRDIFTVRVTNEGLVPCGGSVTVDLVEGSEQLRSGLPVVSVPVLDPGAAVDIRVELTLDRTVDCPLVFRLDGDDGDPTNDTAAINLHPEVTEAPKETVVAFRGWEQKDGKASASWEVDSRNGETGTFTVVVAVYDEFGRMVDTAMTTVTVEGGTARTITASAAEGHTVRAYLVNADGWLPLDGVRTLGE